MFALVQQRVEPQPVVLPCSLRGVVRRSMRFTECVETNHRAVLKGVLCERERYSKVVQRG
jgi:hypothetical protein